MNAQTTAEQRSAADYAIGVDVGGTKVAGGIVHLATGQALLTEVVPTRPERGGETVLAEVVALAERLATRAAEYTPALRGIGIGVPELVSADGMINSAYHFDWRHLDVVGSCAHIAPTTLESDVRAAGQAEAHFGAGRPYHIVAYISIGTGISYCLVVDGQPFAGARGNALVLASGAQTCVCAACGAVSSFVLEEYAAGPALVRRYNQRTGSDLHSGEDIMRAVAAGDTVASEIVSSAGAAVGASLGWLVNVLDPDAVIIGGGLGQAGGLYWQSLERATRQHIWSDNTRDLPIIKALLKTQGGIIGAALATRRI